MNSKNLFPTRLVSVLFPKEQFVFILSIFPENNSIFLAINAKHYNNELELNLHPLNSLLHSYQTYNFLKFSLSHKLPFILSRATFPGSGKYVSHWTGDIKSDWTFMELSIPSMFSFNLFGIPMIGADICGFEGDTTELLCSRWAQLGSLYPFARNHNHEHAKDQEFHKLGPTLLETARKALNLRYSLLKYYYSIFIQSVRILTKIF